MKNNWEEIFTSKIKDILHEKRKTTETHIKQLQQEGKQSVRYTAMMPDIPFLVFGLLSDIGWIIHLAAGITYFCRNGFHYLLDYIAHCIGCCHIRSCLYYLSEQNTRKGNCNKNSKEPWFWRDCLCRISRCCYWNISDRDICRRFIRNCVDNNWRLFKLCFGIADISII